MKEVLALKTTVDSLDRAAQVQIYQHLDKVYKTVASIFDISTY